ncbi:hypothetical protein TrLO_g11686 [Triparma laevis f. longispina]|uniref:Tryptophan synthase beta chain-like PALP domain-containing protein n=1 Tax=Triparma laevis f. longispina TaxID=1714387 RepID=A0A9W7C8K4_9STRA|nr:hypothetical protein TrLO_g11686 [Triparma laevis f. longispina]
MPYCISSEDVDEAYEHVNPCVTRTPVLTSTFFSTLSSRDVQFKCEAFQKTGPFKFRGATNATRMYIEGGGGTAVVTHSSGNHAQALALAGSMNDIPAHIIMPNNAPEAKRRAVEDTYKANVTICDPTKRQETADGVLASLDGAEFIHPSEDPRVIASQGTVSKEAAWGDNVKIVLAEPEIVDDAKRSFESGELQGHEGGVAKPSVADGLKTTLGLNTFAIVKDLCDDIMTVSEKEILRCTKLVWERMKVMIEPSAGVGVGVLISDEFKEKYPADKYKRVGVVLCGGNVDVGKTIVKMQEMGL